MWLQESRHLKIESPETSTRIYHYSLRINPKERSSQVVHRFHQTRKGAHVTKKFKNQCSIGSDKCSCTRSTCWFLYPRQANTRPILPAFLHSRYTKILQKNLFVKKKSFKALGVHLVLTLQNAPCNSPKISTNCPGSLLRTCPMYGESTSNPVKLTGVPWTLEVRRDAVG